MMSLAEKKMPNISARMGRPPLGKTADETSPTPIRFEKSMRASINAARGKSSFAEYVRSAVAEKLEREGSERG